MKRRLFLASICILLGTFLMMSLQSSGEQVIPAKWKLVTKDCLETLPEKVMEKNRQIIQKQPGLSIKKLCTDAQKNERFPIFFIALRCLNYCVQSFPKNNLHMTKKQVMKKIRPACKEALKHGFVDVKEITQK